MNSNNSDDIFRYREQEMSPTERILFEQRLEEDMALREAFEKDKEFHNGLKNFLRPFSKDVTLQEDFEKGKEVNNSPKNSLQSLSLDILLALIPDIDETKEDNIIIGPLYIGGNEDSNGVVENKGIVSLRWWKYAASLLLLISLAIINPIDYIQIQIGERQPVIQDRKIQKKKNTDVQLNDQLVERKTSHSSSGPTKIDEISKLKEEISALVDIKEGITRDITNRITRNNKILESEFVEELRIIFSQDSSKFEELPTLTEEINTLVITEHGIAKDNKVLESKLIEVEYEQDIIPGFVHQSGAIPDFVYEQEEIADSSASFIPPPSEISEHLSSIPNQDSSKFEKLPTLAEDVNALAVTEHGIAGDNKILKSQLIEEGERRNLIYEKDKMIDSYASFMPPPSRISKNLSCMSNQNSSKFKKLPTPRDIHFGRGSDLQNFERDSLYGLRGSRMSEGAMVRLEIGFFSDKDNFNSSSNINSNKNDDDLSKLDTLLSKKVDAATIFFESFINENKEIKNSSAHTSYYVRPPHLSRVIPQEKLEFSFSPNALRTKFWMAKDRYQIHVYQQNNIDSKFCLVDWFEHRYFIHDYFEHDIAKKTHDYFPFIMPYKRISYYPKKTKKILGYNCYLAVVTDEKGSKHHLYITEDIQPSRSNDDSYYLKGCPLEISQSDSEYYKRAVKIETSDEYLEYRIPYKYDMISTDKMLDIIKNYK